MVFEKAQWIWNNKKFTENEYAEFFDSFVWDKEKVIIRISICGDYTLFVNGVYVSSNQYADFSHYKVYDEIDITKFLDKGKNTVCILGWYFGKSGMRYNTPLPGLIYEIIRDGDLACYSNSKTLSRISKAYTSGEMAKISPQLGYSFAYDSTKEDTWLFGATEDFTESDIMFEKQGFYKRPIEKLVLGNIIKGSITTKNNRYIIDLEKEVVGLASFSLISPKKQNINIAYGECLENGRVKRIIENRDFSFDYVADEGVCEYTNYMLRLACRYIEVESEYPININYAGIIPQSYPVVANETYSEKLSGIDKQIYDICLNTLKLCMMEHYVDCPWREQCLYAFDARNQILAGYYAFKGGNYDYARANLLLMSKDNRDDGFLSICFPSGDSLAIPSFSLYYILAIKEYMCHSGDMTLGEDVFVKIEGILNTFKNNMQNGLIHKICGVNYWNFYDWSPYCASEPRVAEEGSDFMINCIAVLALEAYSDICKMLGKRNSFEGIVEVITEKVREKYLNKENGLFFVANPAEEPTELANSLAVLSKIANEKEAKKICEMLPENKLIPCSLSMKTFKYDALLFADEDKYRDNVFYEIRSTYKKMLDADATTVWETIEGADAFNNAGSLCHGWSAIPVFYYMNYLN